MSCSAIHHVEVCVKDETKLTKLLTKGFGFRPFARRSTPQASRWVLRSGNSIFVITKRNSTSVNTQSENGISSRTNNETKSECTESSLSNEDTINIHKKIKITDLNSDLDTQSETPSASDESPAENEPEHWTVFCCQRASTHTIDSVFNVALVVKDVDEVTRKVRSQGGTIIREPMDVSDKYGTVRYAIITSCCGNIVHTLVDKKHYRGHFLPGYKEDIAKLNVGISNEVQNYTSQNKLETTTNGVVETSRPNSLPPQDRAQLDGTGVMLSSKSLPNSNTATNEQDIWREEDPISTFIDHVTYACTEGTSQDVIAWYEHCFGMKRLFTNRNESEAEGFVLGGDIGLRLKALEYWRCSEVGLVAPSADAYDASLKMVLAEALPGVDASQINSFLTSHGGPGIQHIGLHTPTMVATVCHMAHRGVIFRQPPPVYYQEGIKLEEIQEAGHGSEVEKFRELGILLDTESDIFTDLHSQNNSKRYLMQVFTTPIFTEDTFFMEVIQRCGARGFGAGNITALAKSIILHKQKLAQGIIS